MLRYFVNVFFDIFFGFLNFFCIINCIFVIVIDSSRFKFFVVKYFINFCVNVSVFFICVVVILCSFIFNVLYMFFSSVMMLGFCLFC